MHVYTESRDRVGTTSSLSLFSLCLHSCVYLYPGCIEIAGALNPGSGHEIVIPERLTLLPHLAGFSLSLSRVESQSPESPAWTKGKDGCEGVDQVDEKRTKGKRGRRRRNAGYTQDRRCSFQPIDPPASNGLWHESKDLTTLRRRYKKSVVAYLSV